MRRMCETAGGGGYGEATRRDPDKVRSDLLDGKTSPQAARLYARKLAAER